eukprot:6486077-Karenia_brevis.AAC.1
MMMMMMMMLIIIIIIFFLARRLNLTPTFDALGQWSEAHNAGVTTDPCARRVTPRLRSEVERGFAVGWPLPIPR